MFDEKILIDGANQYILNSNREIKIITKGFFSSSESTYPLELLNPIPTVIEFSQKQIIFTSFDTGYQIFSILQSKLNKVEVDSFIQELTTRIQSILYPDKSEIYIQYLNFLVSEKVLSETEYQAARNRITKRNDNPSEVVENHEGQSVLVYESSDLSSYLDMPTYLRYQDGVNNNNEQHHENEEIKSPEVITNRESHYNLIHETEDLKYLDIPAFLRYQDGVSLERR